MKLANKIALITGGTSGLGLATAKRFVFKPGEPHQLIDDSDQDMVICVVADNPIGESVYYHDSKKWVFRGEPLEHYEGKE